MQAMAGQLRSLLHRQPLLLSHRQQLCLVWYVFAWHILLRTSTASTPAGEVGWVARCRHFCLVPSNSMLHQYTRTSAPVSAARAQQRPCCLTLRTQTPQVPTSLDCHQDASTSAAQILCILGLTSNLGERVHNLWLHLCFRLLLRAGPCSVSGYAAAASSSHWSMSIATSSALWPVLNVVLLSFAALLPATCVKEICLISVAAFVCMYQ